MKKGTLSTGKKLLVILLFSISTIFLGILLSFFIKYLYLGITTHDKYFLDEAFIGLVVSFIIGIIFIITLMILLRDYDRNKKEKNIKWYIDKILISLAPVWITIAVVLFSFYSEENEVAYIFLSILSFLVIGIISTPNIVLYALNDMNGWEHIFDKNGNFPKSKKINGFYKIQAPVSFEKKIFFATLKVQLLDFSTVALFIFFFLIITLFSKSYNSPEIKGNLLFALGHTSQIRSEGYMFFGSVFFAAFWIPIFAYYITNAIYKLRIVKQHKYIVYHAIVDKVDTFKIRINNSGVHFKYDYCTCVGIKSKNINKTKAILVFLPDEVLLFPDDKK